MDAIKRSLLIRDLTEITIACTPHMDKDQRNSVLRDLEYQLKKLDKIYNIDIDDDEPEAGAFDRLRKLLGKPKK